MLLLIIRRHQLLKIQLLNWNVLEKQLLDFEVYGIYRSNLSTPEFSAVDREMSPKFSEFSDKINQNKKLFTRVETLYNSKESKNQRTTTFNLVCIILILFVKVLN
jgi:Zn-dependent oligopeptidase